MHDLREIDYSIITTTSQPEGNKPYKIYMGPGPWGNHFKNNMEIYDALEKYTGLSVSFYCEDPIALEQYRTKSTHEQRRPPTCEFEAVEFALNLIKKFKITGRIVNISTFESAELVRKSKVDVLVEFMSEHLMYNLNNSDLVVYPPLRPAYDNQKLIGYLKAYNGLPDCITGLTPEFTKWAGKNLSWDVFESVTMINPELFVSRWSAGI